MAKKYNGETLVNESRYSSYIPQLSSKTQNLIFKRIDELIKENPEYCDKGKPQSFGEYLYGNQFI